MTEVGVDEIAPHCQYVSGKLEVIPYGNRLLVANTKFTGRVIYFPSKGNHVLMLELVLKFIVV